MKLKNALTCLCFCLTAMLFAQVQHNSHGHEHHRNGIGVVNSPVYFINEKELTYALHVHYVRSIKDTKFGVGCWVRAHF